MAMSKLLKKKGKQTILGLVKEFKKDFLRVMAAAIPKSLIITLFALVLMIFGLIFFLTGIADYMNFILGVPGAGGLAVGVVLLLVGYYLLSKVFD
jgi:hypothetical protein